MTSQKTIFILSSSGFSNRYLLRSDIFRTLVESEARIVLLLSNPDEKYVHDEFAHQNVIIEKYEFDKCREYLGKSTFQRFFRKARMYAYPKSSFVFFAHHWYAAEKRKRPSKPTIKKRIWTWAFDLSVALLSSSRTVRRLLNELEQVFCRGQIHRQLFEKYQPDLLITFCLGFLEPPHVIREARHHGARVASIILSWDNPTTKGIPAAIVDRVVTWTKAMKDEMIKLHDFRPHQVFVGGVALYDSYFNNDYWPAQRLFNHFNLDPARKIIFLGLMSPTKFPWNPDLVATLAKLINEDCLSFPCQLLVRMHPLYYLTKNEGKLVKDKEKLLELTEKYNHLRFDIPEVLSEKASFDMPSSEQLKLGAALNCSDVVLCFNSSLMIEACVFDKPVLNMLLHPKEGLPNSVVLDLNHLKRINSYRAIHHIYSENELVETLNECLRNPENKRDERRKVVANEAGPNQGNAGATIGEYLLNIIN